MMGFDAEYQSPVCSNDHDLDPKVELKAAVPLEDESILLYFQCEKCEKIMEVYLE